MGNRIGWRNLVSTDLTHRKTRRMLEKLGYFRDGEQMHHTVAVGQARRIPDWRNNPLMMKPLAKADHKRLTGKWGGLPRYELPMKIWHGTNHWQKSVPVGIGSYTADAVENHYQPPRRGNYPE
jgi:hypothetical protein